MTALPRNRSRSLAVITLAVAAAPGLAAAGEPVPPQNVVNLTASASLEVERDWLTVVFGTTRDGADPAAVQSQMKQALDAALAEARKAARPGQLEVQTGGFSLYPRYGTKGTITGWQGSTELVVQGRDAGAISQLTGRVQTLTISRVGWSVSRQAREKLEADITAEAIARFRARAEQVSRQFGFAGYTVREVSVSADGGGGMPPPQLVRAQAMKASADEALPVEGGKATLNASVSGSVQMTR